MPPAVIDLRTADDPRDVVHRVVQALAEGKLVALPTETVYGVAANALHEKAVERLLAVKGRPETNPLTLAIKSAESAWDYVPRMPPLAARLARRCWPGPITLVLQYDRADSLVRQLPPTVQKAVAPGDTIGFRVPAHDLVLSVLRLTAGPLALSSANRSGKQDAVSAQEVAAAFGNDIDLIIDDGRSKFGQSSSVVRVDSNRLTILRSGVINEATLNRLASFLVLFVCTGNTCRSPMAECLMKHHLSEYLHCKPTELEEHGVLVMSAGVSAMASGKAASEAVAVMQERGLDLTSHESQPVTDRLVRFADVILTMSNSHRQALLAQWPDVAPRVHLLANQRGEIVDPFGGAIEDYRTCAEDIYTHMDAWVQEFARQGWLPEPKGK
jgi:tRNA threonylcarbamoyl adenosine modification protein (Sua5/YciO/YrdC/YwlC family)